MAVTNEGQVFVQDLSGIVGKHFIYTYANGWQYELYVRDVDKIDYRIHSGLVGGRWVREQVVDLVRLADDSYKISWTEPTGTSVSVTVFPGLRRIHGVIFFPYWVHQNPRHTACYQNDHLDKMIKYRDRGPTYPIEVVSEFAQITFLEDCGPGNDSVIACSPRDLPEGYARRTN